MKKPIFLLLVLFLLLGSPSLFSQEELSPHSGAAKVLFLDHGVTNGIDTLEVTNGIEIAYMRNLSSWVRLNFPLKVSVADIAGNINKRTLIGLDGTLQIPFLKGKRLSPYIMGGAGFIIEFGDGMDDSHLQFPLGGGIDIFLGGQSYINLQAEYRKATLENRDNLQIGLGYLFRVLKAKKEDKEDRDEDGISDSIDKCPDEPGPATAAGCPDTDGDGVTDINDNCPEEAGTLAANGCPDADGDGIADKYDVCPEEAGIVARKGCPEKDTDGDGLSDDKDECPEEPGTAETDGCPDTDGDLVPDKYDLCPEEIGKKYTSGCPDKDQDGIADKFDNCPDLAGPPERKGCPFQDQDSDGVADAQDECPNISGPVATAGCPDSDQDGLHDGVDRCPMAAGPLNNSGCPEIQKEVKDLLSMAGRSVEFETGQALLKASSYENLNQIAEVMKNYPDYHLRISGYTDNVGREDKNLALSEERARSCYNYLISRGIDMDRLVFKGYGEANPIASNNTAEGRALNRRVEFELFLK